MRRAFTLVELMVVVAIMGVLLGISIPAFTSLSKKAPLERAISDVEAACRNARSKAILDKRVMEIYLNDTEDIVSLGTATRGIMALDMETGLETKQAEMGEQIESFQLEADLEIIAPRDDESTGELVLRFYPNGTAESVELRVFDSEGSYILVVDPVTGRTTVVNEEEL